jgi:hypothetical protein
MDYVNVSANIDNINGAEFYEFSFHKKDSKIMSKKIKSMFGNAITTIFCSIVPVYGTCIIPVRFYFKKGKFKHMIYRAKQYYQSVKFASKDGPGFIYGEIKLNS